MSVICTGTTTTTYTYPHSWRIPDELFVFFLKINIKKKKCDFSYCMSSRFHVDSSLRWIRFPNSKWQSGSSSVELRSREYSFPSSFTTLIPLRSLGRMTRASFCVTIKVERCFLDQFASGKDPSLVGKASRELEGNKKAQIQRAR